MSVFFLSLSILISLQVTEICVAVLFPWKLFCIVACYFKISIPSKLLFKDPLIFSFSFSQDFSLFTIEIC